jgi:hypothetical protein
MIKKILILFFISACCCFSGVPAENMTFKATGVFGSFPEKDIALPMIQGEQPGLFVSPGVFGGILSGRYLVSFKLKGNGYIKEIGLVNACGTGVSVDTVIASSNILGGRLHVDSSTEYRALLVIPHVSWSEGKIYIRFIGENPAVQPENAFIFETLSVNRVVDPKPIAVYLKNLPAPRIGTDTDEDIIRGLEEDGFYVVELDCAGYPKASPNLEEALVAYHISLPDSLPAILPDGVKVDYKSVFYVPAGYRIAKDIPIWNIKEYGAENVLNYVMDTYNKEIVNKYKIPKVASPDQMKDRNGMPLDYTLRMDIIYPSGSPVQKVPLLLNFSSNVPRFYPFCPQDAATEVIRRVIYPLGFLTSGYAFANTDHCYNPLARNEDRYYRHFNRYTLDKYNGVAYVTSALRFIHSVENTYNLNGRIGAMGISKASYAAVIAANVHNDTMKEASDEYGRPNPEQPWQGYPSTVNVAYAASGDGTNRIPDIVDRSTVPMITSIGKLDKFISHWPFYPSVINALTKADNIHLDMWMEELGHTYPVSGTDYVTGLNRYVLFKAFYDRFLKPDEHVNPEVFYVLPKEGTRNVRPDGTFRSLLSCDILPKDMKGISGHDLITVRFLSPMNTNTIDRYLKVINTRLKTNVKGIWRVSMKNTCFKFIPEKPLEPGTSYTISVLPGAVDLSGNKLQRRTDRTFSVSGGPVHDL